MASDPTGPIGRADLLRVLHAGAAQDMAEQQALALVLGYVPEADPVQHPPAQRRKAAVTHGTRALPVPDASQREGALRTPMLGAAVVAEDSPAAAVPAPAEGKLAPLTAADWDGEPGQPGQRPAMPPIVPESRLVPAVQRALQVVRAAGLDVDALAEQIARRQWPARLPRRSISTAAPHRIVVIDLEGGLSGYRHDIVALLRAAHRPLGGAGYQVRVLVDGRDPLAGWADPTAAARGAVPAVQAWCPLPADARLLLISDLGLCGGAMDRFTPLWRAWLQHVQQQGACVEVWSPVPLGELAAHAPELARLPVVHWNAAAALRPQPLARHAAHHTAKRQAQAQVLLAALSFCPYIDAGLLRAMRLAIWPAPHASTDDAGIEQQVWQSPDLTQGVLSRRMRPEAQARHRQAFGQRLTPAQQQQVQQVAVAYYRQFSQPLVHMHTLGWASRVGVHDADAVHRLGQAREFVQRLSGEPGHAGVSMLETRHFLHAWLHHGDSVEQRACAWRAAALLQAIGRMEPHALRETAIPQGAPHGALARQLAPDAPAHPRWLVHDARHGGVFLGSEPPVGPQSALLAAPLEWATADFQAAPGRPRHWLDLQPERVPLGSMAGAGPAILRTRDATVWLGPVCRPRGVQAWHRDANGLHLRSQSVGALALTAGPQDIQLLPPRADDPRQMLRIQVAPLHASGAPFSIGIHPDHGLYLDLEIAGVVQRFVWIEPTGPQGFVMGSLADERRALSHKTSRDWARNEGPRHRVTISRGFWLADTPCTQALWKAVVGGENPSEFKNGADAQDRPVEQVSWDDVQGRFLPALAEQLKGLGVGGVEPVLPSEAQWEYACRAGSTTAYGWGDEVDRDRANWDHEQGETTAVKRYEPNGWGLYDMHGNVWEWCADDLRGYTKAAVVDPVGDTEGGGRAARGGSWINAAGFARSAYRNRGHRGFRFRDHGFRLALRSPEHEPGGRRAGPGGPEVGRGAPPGGRPDGVAGRPAGAPRRRRAAAR